MEMIREYYDVLIKSAIKNVILEWKEGKRIKLCLEK